MLNKLSKILQCSAITIALAFLIVPYAHAHRGPEYPPDGDFDGDDINNRTDVCVESSYSPDYHESCLTEAGFRAPKTFYIELNDYGRFPVIVEDSTFRDLKIKTCNDLTAFRNEMRQNASTYKTYRWLVGIIGPIAVILAIAATSKIGGIGGVLVGGIVAILLAELSRVIDEFNGYADAANDAYTTLCIRGR